MVGYIYKTTDLRNGKIYVGKHEAAAFDGSYLGSGVIISNEVRAHGKASFRCEMIDSAETLDELWLKEELWIAKLNARDRSVGYNVATGGKGGQRGLRHTDDAKKKISARKGWHHTEATKSKISQSHLGIRPTEETKKRLSESHLGKPSPMKGRHASESAKRKISESLAGRRLPPDRIKKAAESHMKPVRCVELGRVFPSAKDAMAFLGRSAAVTQCCRGKHKTAGGYHWEYAEKSE